MNWCVSLARRLRNRIACRETGCVVNNPQAILAAGAVLEPEATIDNLSGRISAIAIGENSHVRGRLLVYANGGAITLGSWAYVGVRSEIWSMHSITIGNRVMISHNVNIFDNTGHSKDPIERHLHYRRILESGHPTLWSDLPGVTAAPVVIEDDVWISCGVTVLKGVRIGARSVIGAGAVVTHDVEPDTFYHTDFKAVTTRISGAPVSEQSGVLGGTS